MSRKIINLTEILEEFEIGNEVQFDVNHNGSGTTMYTKKAVLLLMKEACIQVLQEAAENVKAYDTIHHWNSIVIDKQSIIDTINQIE